MQRSFISPLLQKNQTIINSVRKELDCPDIPFLVGGLGDFLVRYEKSESMKNYYHINDASKKIADDMVNCAFVSAEGLDSNPDNLHFSAKALDEFGLRYYDEYCKLNYKVVCDEQTKEDDSQRTEMELL